MNRSEVKRGDYLMLFKDGKSLGGATSHTLTITPEYTDISCKDSGLYGWKKKNKVSWEITSENLYMEDEFKALFDKAILTTGDEIDVAFGGANETEANIDSGLESLTPTKTNWTKGTKYYSGKAVITSLTLNAPSGDNATYSITLTGVGAISATGFTA